MTADKHFFFCLSRFIKQSEIFNLIVSLWRLTVTSLSATPFFQAVEEIARLARQC